MTRGQTEKAGHIAARKFSTIRNSLKQLEIGFA
jgi:hypothetical protein